MPVLLDIGLLVTPVRGARQGVVSAIGDAAVAWRGDRITWVGARQLLPASHEDGIVHSAGGALVVPGLIDCHTHLAFAGWRAGEFEQRLLGRSYEEIASAGGGIQRTVTLTREASEETLVSRCHEFLRQMASLGVTTIEAKSGYGLDAPNEIKLLRVYRMLAGTQPVDLVSTLLAAHTVPREYRHRRQEYVRLVCEEIIPLVHAEHLAAFCDVFVDATAFSPAEARTILETAAGAGLRPKLHADQLADDGAALLAAELGAVSADHLEHVSRDGIAALARTGVVAVSLPIATLYLQQQPMPARELLAAGVPVAIATDFNPGTAPSCHLPLAMMLGSTLQRMTPSEVLCGVTLAAAAAIGMNRDRGVIEPGCRADLTVVDAPDVEHWVYQFKGSACTQTWIKGQRVY